VQNFTEVTPVYDNVSLWKGLLDVIGFDLEFFGLGLKLGLKSSALSSASSFHSRPCPRFQVLVLEHKVFDNITVNCAP